MSRYLPLIDCICYHIGPVYSAQLKQQMLKGRTAVDQPMAQSAEPDDKGAVRTSTTTRELASKEKGRQRQEVRTVAHVKTTAYPLLHTPQLNPCPAHCYSCVQCTVIAVSSALL